jgi:rubrerythrin
MNLYQYAQEIEQSGIAFYQRLAGQAGSEGVRRVFGMLAADEEKLCEKLRTFRRRYPAITSLECGSLDPEAAPFEQACDNGQCRRIFTDLDAYRLARDAEQNVVQQYLDAAEAEKNPKIRQMLAWMAALEQHQLRQIEQLYDFAEAPNRSLEWGEFSNLDEFHNFGYYEDLREGILQS